MLSWRVNGAFVLGVLAVLGGLTGAAVARQEKSADERARNGKWEERQVELKGSVGDRWQLAFSPDARTLAAGSFSNQGDTPVVLRLVDAGGKDLRERHKLAGHNKTTLALMAFGAEGKTLISVGADGTAKVWDVEGGKAKDTFAVGKKGEFHTVEGAWLTADGKSLVVFPPPRRAGAFSDTRPVPPRVEIWDPQTRKEEKAVPVTPGLHGMALSPDGKYLVCGVGPVDDLPGESTAQVRFWNLQTGKAAGVLKLSAAGALFSPTGKSIVLQQVSPKDGRPSLAFWDVATNKGSTPAAAALKNSYAHGFSGDGKYLVTASPDKRKVTVWEVGTEKPVGSLPMLDSTVGAAALSADGRTLAVITDLDNILHVWTYKEP
jgi:WD40 repeat protein